MKKKTILIVEDEPLLLETCRIAFDEAGYVALTARDGKEGLEIALREHPDLILLDVLMPVMGGIETLNKLRKDTWGKKAKVVLLTNLTDDEKRFQAESKGVEDYIVKANWHIDEIVDKVAGYLGDSK